VTELDDNLDLLLRFAEAYSERDVDAIQPFVHPEFEFHEPPEQPGAGVFKGWEDAREAHARWSENWLEQRGDVVGFDALPDGRVLVFTRERMLGRDGLRVEQDGAAIFTFRDGKILRWQVFWDPANARAAAGV
jgi:ketosteroid isomerase-like protein